MKDKSNISQELLEVIERYISGGLTTQELKDFNQLLDLDPEFKIQVEDFKTMLEGNKKQSLKKQLDSFNKEVPESKAKKQPKKNEKFSKVRKLAAALAIVIAVTGIWYFSTPINEKIYTNHFKPDPGLPTTTNNFKNVKFYDGMVYYNQGDYNLAITNWSTMQQGNHENDTLNYYIGVAHLANKNIIEAIPYLEHSIEAEDSFTFLDKAYLYLGLAYLKEGNIELAKKYLNISETQTAKNILLELKP
ncbi:tetratricopeptide repeat protein [Algibacter sp. AS12]|uniref:tetratricopeptide repeat protein n=1 Tax=Algibacter sp. AS12 TaxID=3135773 RepID=UPI00398BA071